MRSDWEGKSRFFRVKGSSLLFCGVESTNNSRRNMLPVSSAHLKRGGDDAAGVLEAAGIDRAEWLPRRLDSLFLSFVFLSGP